jgi:gas vesicle protein
MVTKKPEKKSAIGAAVGIGVGIAAASVAAYLLFGPEGKTNRKKISGWSIKMKGEIIEKFEKVKEVTEPIYHEIVDEVSEKYSKLKNIDKEELEAVVEDLRKNWKNIVKEAKPKPKKITKK